MPTKTTAMEVDADELLKAAKRSDHESFSKVVRRRTSERPTLTAKELQVVRRHLLYNPQFSK